MVGPHVDILRDRAKKTAEVLDKGIVEGHQERPAKMIGIWISEIQRTVDCQSRLATSCSTKYYGVSMSRKCEDFLLPSNWVRYCGNHRTS